MCLRCLPISPSRITDIENSRSIVAITDMNDAVHQHFDWMYIKKLQISRFDANR